MAKKKSSLSRKVTIRPMVQKMDAHIKAIRALKKRASPAQRKKIDRHIGKLQILRMRAMDQCDAFFLAID